jgi:coenzyme F420-reducing hydrogenase delta subunit
MNNKKINIYVDESGDTGIKFNKGSSELFIVSFLYVNNSELEKIEQILKEIIHDLDIYPKELKFSSTSFKNKTLFLNRIKNLNFKAEIFVYKKYNKNGFYHFIKQSLENITIHPETTYKIIIDGIDDNKLTTNNIKNIKTLFKELKPKIIFLDSRKSLFLQLSDMLAGLVHSIYKNKEDYNVLLKKLKDKVKITQIE